jgi:PPOX class probable F420-dependent enzyme
MAIPHQLAGQKYISLTTFKKDGTGVRTPLWFAENDGKLYVMTRNDSWKYKRIRNNPKVEVAASNFRGKLTGPEFLGRARILPPQDWKAAHKLIQRKYWLARLPFSSKKNEFVEIELAA